MKAVKSMIAAAFLASVPATTAFAAPPPENTNGANAEIFAYCTALMEEYPGLSLAFHVVQPDAGDLWVRAAAMPRARSVRASRRFRIRVFFRLRAQRAIRVA